VRVDGQNLVFGPTTSTRRACQEPERTIERRVLAVLDGPADSVQTEGQVLIVTKGTDGLVFNVR
jgi:heat shock protein HslJ